MSEGCFKALRLQGVILHCTWQSAELWLFLTQDFSFLHPLPRAYIMLVKEHTHSPETTGATTSKLKFSSADADQVTLSHSDQHAMCVQVYRLRLCGTRDKTWAGIPQAPEMMLENMKKRHVTPA